jgi:hypothetical protein
MPLLNINTNDRKYQEHEATQRRTEQRANVLLVTNLAGHHCSTTKEAKNSGGSSAVRSASQGVVIKRSQVSNDKWR